MKIEDGLHAFTFDVLQSSVSVYTHLDRLGFTVSDLISFVREKQKEDADRINKQEKEKTKSLEEYNRIAPKCPECKLPLVLKGISTPEGKGNLRGYKSLLYCNGPTCLYEKYSRKPADYLYRQMVKNSKKEKANGS